jgi:hypothetical protein
MMAAAGKCDESPDTGFVHAYDARAAKRQVQISVALVIILAFAAAAIGVLAQLERPQGRLPGYKLGSAEATPR